MSAPTVWTWKGVRPSRGWRSIFALRIPWWNVEWPILFLAGILVGASLLFVKTMGEADLEFGRDGVDFASHVKKILVALPFLVLGFLLRPRWLRRNAWTLFAASLVLLVLVPILGEERNGARRWIPLFFGFDLQPSELAKIGLVLALARALYRSRLAEGRDWVAPALIACVPMGLVAAQPDLGTALTIVPVTLGTCLLAGARGRVILGLVLAAVLALFLAWKLELVHGYQAKRIETWLAALDSDALIESKNGTAFHTYQARVAIGNGGLRGRGLGRGVANEAGHLPERDCDSIFAVIAEEGGFIGASAFVLAYTGFCALLFITAAQVRERFSRLVVGGVALYFASHFFINAGVNLGLIPMTGLTLPLVSTGGSSLLASFLALGLALGMSARPEPSLDSDAFRG
jgi:rod shape determining protein RodA